MKRFVVGLVEPSWVSSLLIMKGTPTPETTPSLRFCALLLPCSTRARSALFSTEAIAWILSILIAVVREVAQREHDEHRQQDGTPVTGMV